MKKTVLATLVALVCQPALAQDDACEGGDLDFDINATVTWKIAPGERFQLIADLSEPALYEICRNGAIQPRSIEITSDGGVLTGVTLDSNSCALVYSKRIGVFSETPMLRDAATAGTYRRIGESAAPVTQDIIQFQAQVNRQNKRESKFHIAAVTAGAPGDTTTRQTDYRICLDNIFATLPSGFLSGMTLWVDGVPKTRFPIDREAAVFGSGSCVDFEGGNVQARMTRANDDVATYKACGKVAFGAPRGD